MNRTACLLGVALLCGACGTSVGKGDYGWFGGGISETRQSRGALRVQWRRELTPPQRGAYRPVENAVPAVDAKHGRVYVGARSGQLNALGLDGTFLYRFDLHEPIEGEPALDPERNELYIGTERGDFYAFAPAEGRIRWHVETTGAVRQKPVLFRDAVYLFTEEDVIEALARADGSRLWRYQRERTEGFLVAGHSGLTLTSDGRLLAGFGDGAVVCLDALDGRVKWERDTSLEVPEAEPGRPRYTDVDTTPVLLGDVVYAASFGAGLYALDANNGSVLWRDPEWTGITSMAVTEDGALILVSGDRGIARFDVTQRGARWIKPLERGSFGVPELWRGLLVVGDSRGSLVALDVDTGDELGRIDAGHGFVARAALEGGRGFVVTNGGVLLSMRVLSPEPETPELRASN